MPSVCMDGAFSRTFAFQSGVIDDNYDAHLVALCLRSSPPPPHPPPRLRLHSQVATQDATHDSGADSGQRTPAVFAFTCRLLL
jgi:hypothetical protein